MEYEFALPIGAQLKSPDLTYVVVETLGYGSFGITYKVSSTIMVNNVPITTFFAVKEHFMKGCYRDTDGCTMVSAPSIKKDVELSRKDFIIEAKRLNKMSGMSPNIVKVNEVFEYYGTAYYVMQYLDGGEMSEHLEKEGALSEAQSLAIIRPIAEAVKLIHKERLLHLDIKPGNIVLMTDPSTGNQYPVLIDFGIAKHFSSTGAPTSSISAKGASNGYAPQEQYSEVNHFAPEIDVYALGATLLHFLSGEQPKNAFDITPEDINAMLPDAVSNRTRKAILAAMESKKTQRTPTVAAFLESLEEVYTLPAGFLLNGQMAKYRIVGIHSETDSYIVYDAVAEEETDNLIEDSEEVTVVGGENNNNESVIEDDDSPTVSLDAQKDKKDDTPPALPNESECVIEDDDNPTVSMDAVQQAAKKPVKKPVAVAPPPRPQKKEAPMSSSVKYLVYECFSKTKYKRYDDGTVAGYDSSVHFEFEKAKAGIPVGFLGNKASNGLPLAEGFGSNGTIYFTYMLVTKQPGGIKQKSWFSRNLKLIGFIVGGLALVAGLTFGGIALYKNFIKGKPEPATTEQVKPEDDTDSLKLADEAKKDSLKAAEQAVADSLKAVAAKAKADSIAKAKADSISAANAAAAEPTPTPAVSSSSSSENRDKPQRPQTNTTAPSSRPQSTQQRTTTRPQQARPQQTRPQQTQQTRPQQMRPQTSRPSGGYTGSSGDTRNPSTYRPGNTARPGSTTRPGSTSRPSVNTRQERNNRAASNFDD